MLALAPDGLTFPAQRCLEDGDSLDGDKFEAFTTDTAQRTQFLKLAVDALLAGIDKIKTVASVATLKTATGMVGGQVVLLANIANLGIFMFVAGAVFGSDVVGWRYDANDGTGYWLRLDSALGTPGALGNDGLPRLNTTLWRAPSSILHNGYSLISSPTSETLAFPGGGGNVDVIASAEFAVVEGDQVDVDVFFAGVGLNDAFEVQLQLQLSTDAGVSYGAALAQASAFYRLDPCPATYAYVPMATHYRMNVGPGVTSIRFKASLYGSGGSSVFLLRPVRIKTLVIRP